MSEPHYWSISELTARLDRGDVSSEEVTNHLLERIDRLEPKLSSYVTILRGEALDQARRADMERRAGLRRGPLHGVPIAVKDIFYTEKAPTTAGSTFLGDINPRWNATVIDRLDRAGAVLLGKLAMTEGALSEHPPGRPAPVNPWHADYWTGISSSGSGVATAAGLCFASVGTDTGGSVRMPSSACGLSGMKPTYGRVSRHGLFPLCEGRDHIGPMARSVEDSAALLGVIAGRDVNDPTAIPGPVADYLADIGRGMEGVRIGFDPAAFTRVNDPELATALGDAVKVFAALGAQVREIEYPSPSEYLRCYFAETAAEVALAHADIFPANADRYGKTLRATIEAGAAIKGQDVVRVQHERMRFAGAIDQVFAEIDVLFLPVLPVATQLAEKMAQMTDPAEFIMKGGRFTIPFNATGHPSLVVPCGFGGNGLPLAMQLIGRHVEESLLFRVGHAYQRITDWHTRRPPLD